MTRDTGYRFLDPAALARIKNLSLAARGVVEGFFAGIKMVSPGRSENGLDAPFFAYFARSTVAILG